MKHTIEVEVPDGWEVIPQHEPLILHTEFFTPSHHAQLRIPMRPVWQYPEWLGGAGVAMDSSGQWVVYRSRPLISVPKDEQRLKPAWACIGCWRGDAIFIIAPTEAFPLWSPPPCADWRESWHPNPNWKG